LPNQIKEFRLT